MRDSALQVTKSDAHNFGVHKLFHYTVNCISLQKI